MKSALLLAACMLATIQAAHVAAQPATSVAPQDWETYRQYFIDPDGRVVDTGNGGISHSEGQGYGMLLAYLAGNRSDFDMIWSFTQNELLLRNDGLAAWKWDPASTPHVTDINNATDGDMLIAYALALAGKGWGEPGFTSKANGIVHAIAAHMVIEHNGLKLLLPGANGFTATDRPDGPVVNLSYWIFEAFPAFAELDPTTDWKAVSDSGLTLIDVLSKEDGLPPEWVSLAARPKPAKGFDAEFSYNAFRIPLYLAGSSLHAGAPLRSMAQKMSSGAGIAIIDLANGSVKQVLSDPGYRIIPALARCEVDGKPVPDELRTFTPTLYYPSTLHLLALARLNATECGR
ncbi:endoglucanase [Aquamicrobium terrae]